MSLAIVHSRAQLGITAPPVAVEVHLGNGLPGLSMVGLPETAVRESKDRVRSALLTSRFEFPSRRITVNLAPADLPKYGGRFDLPIAVGILAASGQLPATMLDRFEFYGELALNGRLRGVRGILPSAQAAMRDGRAVILAAEDADEAALLIDAEVYAAERLLAVTAHLNGQQRLARAARTSPDATPADRLDLADVRGQQTAKRGLEIAAAGGHSVLLIGPPGTGKTMLASRLAGILPPLTDEEALETAAVHSVYDGWAASRGWRERPFRAPHHGASMAAVVGGGSHPRPGEISLAHHGVLFLDELPEFDRRVLESLREPVESGHIHISRAAQRISFPARFQLVAAMNPCPCGYLGDPAGRCRCSGEQVQRYRTRVSGPLLDRIDMHIQVPPVPHQLLRDTGGEEETSEQVQARVAAARGRQYRRQGALNRELRGGSLSDVCGLDADGQSLLDQAMGRLGLSARSYHRILRIARTIADLEARPTIASGHIAEAVGLRCLDRRMPNS